MRQNFYLFVSLLATLYDHMIMYVGLFGHFAVVFHILLTVCYVHTIYFTKHKSQNCYFNEQHNYFILK